MSLLTDVTLSNVTPTLWHTNLYHHHYHDEAHMIPPGRSDCWAVNVKDWQKHSVGCGGDFHASHEAVPDISEAPDVIFHVLHHGPLLFSATDRMRYDSLIFI